MREMNLALEKKRLVGLPIALIGAWTRRTPSGVGTNQNGKRDANQQHHDRYAE
jgi:hypothetical protein